MGPGDTVLEVGPGLGSLTLSLLATGASVVGVEIDPRLAGRLPDTVAAHQPDAAHRLRVVIADAVAVTPELVAARPTRFVANLPYNVAVPVVLRVLELFPDVATGLVMVQAEVAERLAAPPGSRVYGIPSAKLAWWASARRAGSVPASVFWPVPRVESGLVEVRRREPPGPGALRPLAFAVIDAAFGQRRKGLRSALAPLVGSPQAAEAVLRSAGVDPLARGEQLDVSGFARIAAAVATAPGRAGATADSVT